MYNYISNRSFVLSRRPNRRPVMTKVQCPHCKAIVVDAKAGVNTCRKRNGGCGGKLRVGFTGGQMAGIVVRKLKPPPKPAEYLLKSP